MQYLICIRTSAANYDRLATVIRKKREVTVIRPLLRHLGGGAYIYIYIYAYIAYIALHLAACCLLLVPCLYLAACCLLVPCFCYYY